MARYLSARRIDIMNSAFTHHANQKYASVSNMMTVPRRTPRLSQTSVAERGRG
jgi:hypothetical protein